MTDREIMLCNGIIHSASAAAAAAGAGLAQIPASDTVIITPIQVAMAVSLAQVFGITLEKSAAKASVASATAAKLGRTASQVFLAWLPGIGNVVNAATAAGLTEAVGWIMARDFERQSVKA